MRIFVISRGCPTPSDPTWGCFELDQAVALSELGHEVIMLSVDTRTRLRWRKIGISEHTYGHVYALDMFIFPCSYRIVGRELGHEIVAKLLLRLYDYACQKYGKPDILYSHYLFNSQLAVAVKQAYHVPLVAVEHWSALNIRPVPQWVRTMVSATYPYADKVITVSESLKQSINECHNTPDISVVHNMVGKEFTYVPLITPHTGIRLVTTGSLLPVKGHDILFQALSRIPDSVQWELLVIGAGKQLPQLQQLADTLKISKHIQFGGKKTKQEIAQIYHTCDIYVSASRSETFGVAITEALACGLPAISTDCGGPRDIITPDNGLLVPTENPAALAEAIKTMYLNRTNYNRQAIAADCQARFSPEVIARQLTDIFQQVIAKQ